MGTELMPPAISNPDGHFEDMPLVNLHDRLLRLNDTDWRFSDESAFDPSLRIDLLSRYLHHRNTSESGPWGAKDPRACLFLPAWRQLLGKQGQYLVILRHWSGSIQSLWDRHSKELAFGLGNMDVHLSFWQSPELAAHIWLAYHQRIISLLEETPEQCLVVSHRSLLQGLPLINEVSSCFGLELNATTPSPIRHELSQDSVDNRVRNLLPDALIDELEAVWNNLLAYIDHRAQDESPHWTDKTPLQQNKQVKELLHLAESQPLNTDKDNLSLPESLLDQLKVLAANPQLPLEAAQYNRRIINEARFSGKHWEQLARAQLRRGDARGAKHSLIQVMTSGQCPPYVYMLLGDCFKAELDYAGAEHSYQQAIKLNRNNPMFHTRLAGTLLVQGRNSEAIEVLQQAISHLPEQPTLAKELANCLDQQGDTDQALTLLQSYPEPPHPIENLLIALTMKTDYTLGKPLFDALMREKMEDPVLKETIAYTLSSVTGLAAREDLAQRISAHWGAVRAAENR
ncbi:tetratricopeptide repeat protein [Amphritea pacifica]|uniref:tetratricopeptide repeat protein n=1 Tax=Amphritea pacifica TaxID=2811233 RepID=UPI0019642FFA|nr:tetratricopeptide repeat protein [Amphritea pacifica]MBN1006916.1 tetratricopeptide repeat protein [Amphritea pacifica]